MVLIKGFDIAPYKLLGSSSRRAMMYKNAIITNLRKIGVLEDDIELELIPVAIKKMPAVVSWYFDDIHLYFSYSHFNFIGNLHIIATVIEKYVTALITGQRSIDEFITDFTEERDVETQRVHARKLLGVGETLDATEIDKAYKKLAKIHHPDMGGDIQLFQEINRAHKLLKREVH